MTDTSQTQPNQNWLGKILRKPETALEDTQNTKSRKRMMSAAERFHHLRVEDVMVPRANIVGIERDTGLHDLSAAFRDAAHSRLPVYKETLDEPLGMIHIKDLMPLLMLNAKGRNAKTYASKKVAAGILRPVLYVPPSMLAEELLARMQARRIHMAIVVDEYGGTDGHQLMIAKRKWGATLPLWMKRMMPTRLAGLSLPWRGACQSAARLLNIPKA